MGMLDLSLTMHKTRVDGVLCSSLTAFFCAELTFNYVITVFIWVAFFLEFVLNF